MSANCPSCGVAVVPGYVRCPKCQKPLPRSVHKTPVIGAGGTAVPSGDGFPVVPVVVGLAILGGIVAFMVTRGGDKTETATPASPAAPTQPVAGPVAVPQTTTTIAAPTVAQRGPDPAEIAAIIDHDLKKQRLWGTVEVIGARVDVRSGGCGDPAMGPLLDRQMKALEEAGLTKLRCLEQSGRVVFERDL